MIFDVFTIAREQGRRQALFEVWALVPEMAERLVVLGDVLDHELTFGAVLGELADVFTAQAGEMDDESGSNLDKRVGGALEVLLGWCDREDLTLFAASFFGNLPTPDISRLVASLGPLGAAALEGLGEEVFDDSSGPIDQAGRTGRANRGGL